jgi:light-regulated signal transduction histidine kinase (bacteriophytochrome)
VFHNWFHPGYVFERAFIIIPFLIWASIRVDQKILIILFFVSAVMALVGTLMGRGPFGGASLNESLITVEVFVSINSVMVLLLQAAIMERRKHEQYLNAARKDLESIVLERTKELHSKNQQLEKRNNELTIFSYSATHDLREPLRKIDFFSNKILESNSIISAPERDLIKRIKATTQRMNQLIENLLSYSLLEAHEKPFKQTDLNFVLSEVKNALAEDIQRTGAVINSVELPVINGVRSQFVQLFTNILGNSLKFRKSETPPRISIGLELVSEVLCPGEVKTGQLYFHLIFRDNGIGFEKQYAGQVFEILQKLHGQNEYEGTGIGLAICKKVVENHNGLICADAEPGKGTAIHIYLPVVPSEDALVLDKKLQVDIAE